MGDYANHVAYADTLLLLLTLQCLLLQLDGLKLSLWELLYEQEQVERPSSRFNPYPKPARQTWHEFSNMLSDDLFRRMFRMPKETFAKLCNEMKEAVGEDSFKSEGGSNGWRACHEMH
jgi:hypothetical protein